MSEYPTDAQLDEIRTWPGDQLVSWFAYIKAAGNYWPDGDFWTQKGATVYVSTGGWSGNEDILDAMQENFACWARTWYSHRRGGHYEFHLPPEGT